MGAVVGTLNRRGAVVGTLDQRSVQSALSSPIFFHGGRGSEGQRSEVDLHAICRENAHCTDIALCMDKVTMLSVASRMESTSLKDHTQCSAPFMQLLKEQWPEVAALAAAQPAFDRLLQSKGHLEPESIWKQAVNVLTRQLVRGTLCRFM
eukprot:1014725-Pelagomonas_calceolata.AAC.4